MEISARVHRAETTVSLCSLTSCVWAYFPDRFPQYACMDSGIVSPLRLRWVKGVCVFRCNPPPALLAERPGSFTRHCGNTGMEWTPNKSQHTKLTLEKKILLPLLPGFELTTFRVRRSYQQAIHTNIETQQSSTLFRCKIIIKTDVIQYDGVYRHVFQFTKPSAKRKEKKRRKKKERKKK